MDRCSFGQHCTPWPAMVIVLALLAPPGLSFSCTGGTIPNSNRTAVAGTACAGAEGQECAYACSPGYLRRGRHICQSYTTQGQLVIDQSFYGGHCAPLCGGHGGGAACGGSSVPVRYNTSDGCLTTVCLEPDEALRRLARGAYSVFVRGRNNFTGAYIDHVDPSLPAAAQPSRSEASADSTGVGIVAECVGAALGFVPYAEARSRVLTSLRSLNATATTATSDFFAVPRNRNGWLPTFFDANTGANLAPGVFSTDSTAFNTAGVLFARTFFARHRAAADGDAAAARDTAEIAALADDLFARVRWVAPFCVGAGPGQGAEGVMSENGSLAIPWLMNTTTGCSDPMAPAMEDGIYDFNEMIWYTWLCHQSACGGAPESTCNATASGYAPIEAMWQNWQQRRLQPNFYYAGHALLSLWPSYLVQLPYYLVHPFGADASYRELFAAQWQAEWAYANSSSMRAGEAGRYGSGAGPTPGWCTGGVLYKADLLTNATDEAPMCRMISPYAVAGYLPAAPDIISGHLLELLASGETVLPVVGTEDYVLWRKSLIDPMWTLGYGITLVDFAAELYGLSTLWLGADFFQQNTNHWPEADAAGEPRRRRQGAAPIL